MGSRRTPRLNSLLKEVFSDIIRGQMKNPKVSQMTTVTKVEVTSDLDHAKVYISVFGSEQEQKDTLNALKSASGFIRTQAAKEVVLRRFPALFFYIDRSAEDYMKIEETLKKIKEKESTKSNSDQNSDQDEN